MTPGRPLRSVPEVAPRGLGMIRVSKERDGMVSPDVQRAAITDWAARAGVEVTGWLEGLDESGSRARSAWWPRLEQAVSQVEAGQYDVIVVWKFSRVARNRLKWATAVDRVEQAGGRIESATEQVDVTTSTGRFTRGMLAELQAFEAERIGEVWKEVHGRRVASGRPASGKPKFGYLYDQAAKVHLPDPVTGPVLVEVYRRYVAGESVYALVRWLNAHGYRTTSDGLWSDRALRRVLDAGFATGSFRRDGDLVAGVHQALVDQRLWLAYVDARARRRAGPRRERSQYLLSGLVRCARCQGSMVAGQYGSDRKPKYRCKRGKESGPQGCAGGYVMAHLVEAAVLETLRVLAGDTDERRAAKVAASARRTAVRSERVRLERTVAQAGEALARLAAQDARRPLPEDVYASTYAELLAELQQVQSVLDATGTQERRAVADPGAVAKELLRDWHETPVATRREGIARVVARVEVLTGRPRASFRVVPAYEGD